MESTTNKQPTFNAPEIKLHFLDYWRIIRIRKTVILAVFLLVTLTTTLVTFILPESYSSTVRISVEKDAQDIESIGGRPNASAGFYDPYFLQTEFEKIQSKSVLYTVITNLDLNTKWAARYKEEGSLRTDVTFLILKGHIDVRQSRNTTLIEIRVFSEEKDEAAKIANTIAEVYRETRLALKKSQTQRGIATLKAKWEEQNLRVLEKQTNVNELRKELRISDIGDSGYMGQSLTLEPETVRKFESLRVESLTDYNQLNTLYGHLTNLSRIEFRKAVSTANPDPQLAALMDHLAESEVRLVSLEADYEDTHPDVIKMRQLVGKINTQIEDRLDGILAGLKAKVASKKAGLDSITEAFNSAKSNDIVTAAANSPYWTAKADLQNLKFIREKLAVRMIQEEIDMAINKTSIVEIVDKAEAGLRPVRPNKPLSIALGVMVGLAVGIGLAFFIEYLDTSVKTIDDVERALQAPVLGVIPQNVGSLLDEGPDSPHAEAYRVLRTNVLFSRKDASLNTMTIVSGGAGEGKSTTMFNLAIIFAQSGQRILIIDSDLRRPSIHKLLRLSNSIGLTNFLMKQNTLEEVIQTTSLPTLDFMPSGKLPSSSMGILSSVQMKELIREVKRRYDFVFFDSPPIMGVSDASILASEVDLVLQVIQYRRYPQPMTIRAKQMIEKVGGNLLGIVLNNINMAQDENYYYYSGYYYDYYSKRDDYSSGEYGGRGEYGRGEYSSRGEYSKHGEYSKPGQIQKDKLAADATSNDKKGDQPPPKAEIKEKL